MMNQRGLSELRRRLNPDKMNHAVIHGCYISEQGKIISTFDLPVFQASKEEAEKYFSVFKRVLSGSFGQNLLSIPFTSAQVLEGESHALLTRMNASALKEEESVQLFYEKVIRSMGITEQTAEFSVTETQNAQHTLVLLLHDCMDVSYHDNNGELDHEQDSRQFSYFLCAVCPVKQSKPVLSFCADDLCFHNQPSAWNAGMPDYGFMFPSYENGGADIYSSLFYTRDLSDLHPDFLQTVFEAEDQMPASEQKAAFQTVLEESLGEDCSMELVQTVHETISNLIDEQKKDKSAEPLFMTRQDVKTILESSGVPVEKTEVFDEKYSETFGQFAELPAVNVVTPKKFAVVTPSVSIKVDPEKSGLIETRMIDGKPYIMILADEGVEVNGVHVTITEPSAEKE